MAKTRSGEYRDAIDIRRDVSPEGDPNPSYGGAPWRSGVPCAIETPAGSETADGRQLTATCTHLVRLHYLPGLLPTMRLEVISGRLKGSKLEIVSVTSDLRESMLGCRETVA